MDDTTRAKWLVTYGSASGDGTRVVCLPHAGGSARSYPWLRPALPADSELVCVQYPGRQERRHEPPIEDVSRMVAMLADAIAPRRDQPIALFGHSLGALLAFELARTLENNGVRVTGLIASGRRAPARNPPTAPRPMTVDELVADLHELQGTDPVALADTELLELIVPPLRADYHLAHSYRYRDDGRLRCPITVLTGASDLTVSFDDARAWKEHTTGEFHLHSVPGGHFFVAEDRAATLGLIRAALTGMGLEFSGGPSRPAHH